MGEQLHFSMDGEFLTAIARDWFWNMDKPYKKCEELLLSCMMGGNEEEKRRCHAERTTDLCVWR